MTITTENINGQEITTVAAEKSPTSRIVDAAEVWAPTRPGGRHTVYLGYLDTTTGRFTVSHARGNGRTYKRATTAQKAARKWAARTY